MSYLATGRIRSDTTPPVISITSPLNGASFVLGSTALNPLVVKGTASDNLGIQKITLTANSVNIPVVASADFATWSASLSVTSSGTLTITARATDLSGNVSSKTINLTVTVPTPPPAAVTGYGVIVPVYGSLWNPTLVAQAQSVIDAKKAHPAVPMVVIVNPNSGPSSAVIQSVTDFCNAAKSAGIRLIGYVSTQYGARAITSIQADISAYKQFYPQLEGIFFDETDNHTTTQNYYQQASEFARTKNLTLVVGNPGTAVPESFLPLMSNYVIYENAGYPSVSTISASVYYPKYPVGKFSIMAHTVTTLDSAWIDNMRQYVGLVYLTHTPDYGILSSIFAQTMIALDPNTPTTPPPPVVSFVTPTNGATISGSYKVTIGATSAQGVAKVQLFINNNLFIKPDGTNAELIAPYDFTVDTTKYPDGTYSFKGEATDNNGKTASATISVTIKNAVAPPPSTVDKWGIKKLYPTKAAGREYYINMAATTMTQLEDGGMVTRLPATLTRNADGSWRVPKSETPRWVITTPSGAAPWRNVEMTAQMKLVDAGSGTYLQMYCRGEQHSTDRTQAWHGSANKARMRFDGRFAFIKELYHETGNSGYASMTSLIDSGIGNILNKWVTWKFVCYNSKSSGNPVLEIWVDKGANNFVKVTTFTDTGGWNASSGFTTWMAQQQSAYSAYVPKNRDTNTVMKQNEKITWGGGYVSFRSDNSTYDFKNVSVREIEPPA